MQANDSAGALAVAGPALVLPHASAGVGVRASADQRLFLVLVPIALAGAMLARSLSPRVEAPAEAKADGQAHPPARVWVPLGRSRGRVLRLSGLFAVDAFGGGFVMQSFLAYWLRVRFDASVELLGVVFFAVGLLQAGWFVAATRLAERIGLLATMVFTHLPSNLLLAAVPLAPNLPAAVALLLGRFALSQMDVPTRQAYVIALVDPAERTAAVATTNLARYLTRPAAPAVAGVILKAGSGLPFGPAGTIKAAYNQALWAWFRRVQLPTQPAEPNHDQPDRAPAAPLQADTGDGTGADAGSRRQPNRP